MFKAAAAACETSIVSQLHMQIYSLCYGGKLEVLRIHENKSLEKILQGGESSFECRDALGPVLIMVYDDEKVSLAGEFMPGESLCVTGCAVTARPRVVNLCPGVQAAHAPLVAAVVRQHLANEGQALICCAVREQVPVILLNAQAVTGLTAILASSLYGSRVVLVINT